MPRHFIETAFENKISTRLTQSIIAELLQDIPRGLNAVEQSLPKDFPEQVFLPLVKGIKKRLAILRLQ